MYILFTKIHLFISSNNQGEKRKFEMLNLTFLKKELDQLSLLLDKLFGKEQFKVSKEFIEDLKKLG